MLLQLFVVFAQFTVGLEIEMRRTVPWYSKLFAAVFCLGVIGGTVGCGGGEPAPATPPGVSAEDSANAVSEATNPSPKKK